MASARGILNIQSLNELTSRMAVWGWRMRLRMRARLSMVCARVRHSALECYCQSFCARSWPPRGGEISSYLTDLTCLVHNFKLWDLLCGIFCLCAQYWTRPCCSPPSPLCSLGCWASPSERRPQTRGQRPKNSGLPLFADPSSEARSANRRSIYSRQHLTASEDDNDPTGALRAHFPAARAHHEPP